MPRPKIGDSWHSQRDWPTHNLNDGMYLGLPRTLARLYEREKPELDR
jgi:hypothetical protein